MDGSQMMWLKFIHVSWKKTKSPIFWFLVFLEQFYKLGFYLAQLYQKNILKKLIICDKRVISIGNISTGGVGKTPFTFYLFSILQNQNPVIFLRGYKSEQSRKSYSLFIPEYSKNQKYITGYYLNNNTQDIVKIHINSLEIYTIIGDEALTALKKNIPVCVGLDRKNSYKLLKSFEKKFQKNYKIILLDDGYQNHKLSKNLDILLLDSRDPFSNGHMLPAGNLREKDITRASSIILTHIDKISKKSRQKISQKIEKIMGENFRKNSLFFGAHSFLGLYNFQNKEVNFEKIKVKKISALAGIGSFDNFIKTIEQQGVLLSYKYQFSDHYNYKKNDLEKLLSRDQNFITTEKDWTKLSPLLEKYFPEFLPNFYILKINFLVTEPEKFRAILD